MRFLGYAATFTVGVGVGMVRQALWHIHKYGRRP